MTDIYLLRNCTPAANKHSLSRCVVVHILLTNLNEQVYITYRGSWYCGVCVRVTDSSCGVSVCLVKPKRSTAWWRPSPRATVTATLMSSSRPVSFTKYTSVHFLSGLCVCVCACVCVFACVCMWIDNNTPLFAFLALVSSPFLSGSFSFSLTMYLC